MIKKKHRRVGYGPMGTPGTGPGQHHRAAASGSGRLGRAMRSVVRNVATAPKMPKKTETRALARWENEGGEVEAASKPAEPSTTPEKKGRSSTRKKSRPPAQAGTVAMGGLPASKRSAADSTQQQRAMTVAKDDRIKEAGLGGKLTGTASAGASALRAAATRNTDDCRAPDIAHDEKENNMQVQVNSDHNIDGSEQLDLHVQSTVEASLGRFGEQITRVEVHLSDDNGDRSRGDDKRCLLEARPAGMQPVVVTHLGGTVDEALEGAVEMMEKLLDSTFHKIHDPKGRTSLGEETPQ